MISVPEAAKYFGIGTKQMRRLAENHLSDFAIFMGSRYLIVRPRFEEYVIAFIASGEKQFRYTFSILALQNGLDVYILSRF